jgi:phosphohistidine phosphatase
VAGTGKPKEMNINSEQSMGRLYLVRHGEAKPKDEDPARGLTDVGRADVSLLAAWAAAARIRVDEIRHSGKLRAQQTAEILAEHLGTQSQAVPGLAPNDDPADIAMAISSEASAVMLVGHLPFLERLAALLIVGSADSSIVTLDSAALMELTRTDKAWKATYLMQPRLMQPRLMQPT